MDLSVIIINYNTTSCLKECLNSIYRFTVGLECEVIVVDNNSTERDIENFPELYGEGRFFFLNFNNGFGAGCNYGASKATGKYLVFVNPDVIFSNNALYEFFKFMEKEPEAGLVSGAFTNLEGKLTYSYNEFPGYRWEFMEALGGGDERIVVRLLKRLEANSEARKPFEVDWIYGACMFIRADLFHKAKGFDESLFLYYEDVDLQYKIKQMGYKVFCIPYLRIKHLTNSSVKSLEGQSLSYFHFHRSKVIYMYKHFNFLKRSVVRIMYILGIFFRMIVLPFRLKFRGRKYQRFLQYREVLKLYFSGGKKIMKAKAVIT